MKEQEITSLIRHRLEQAQTALEDAQFLHYVSTNFYLSKETSGSDFEILHL